jgi:hypothetical protein
MASRIIGDTEKIGLIKPYDPASKSRKHARYVPLLGLELLTDHISFQVPRRRAAEKQLILFFLLESIFSRYLYRPRDFDRRSGAKLYVLPVT